MPRSLFAAAVIVVIVIVLAGVAMMLDQNRLNEHVKSINQPGQDTSTMRLDKLVTGNGKNKK